MAWRGDALAWSIRSSARQQYEWQDGSALDLANDLKTEIIVVPFQYYSTLFPFTIDYLFYLSEVLLPLVEPARFGFQKHLCGVRNPGSLSIAPAMPVVPAMSLLPRIPFSGWGIVE